MSNQNEGSLRILKHGEVTLAKRVFGDTIEYHKVWIHHGSFFPFELQDDETTMSPNGELYFVTGTGMISPVKGCLCKTFSSMR